ncbi:MAG: hypothetical protein NC093_09590 [Alistipes sp.]|nr:hypothetical protein [Alistipes sp.]
MKKASTYILSFVISLLLVFTLVGTAAGLTVSRYANEKKVVEIADEKNITGTIREQLEKYFSQRYSSTGIPADIYMDALSDEYLHSVMESKIQSGFAVLDGTNKPAELSCPELEKAISGFYSDYAESIGYEKDAKYDEIVANAKNNAYSVINDYCDAYKLSALEKHGVISKISPLYRHMGQLVIAVLGAAAVMLILLIIVNRRSLSAVLYWSGASALLAGAIGFIPCQYLLSTDYFGSFTIKQAQVYTAYTGAMKTVTEALAASFLAAAIVGVLLIAVYAVICIMSGDKAENKK